MGEAQESSAGQKLSVSLEQPRAFSPVSGTFGSLGLDETEWQSLAIKRLRYVLYVCIALGICGGGLSLLAQPNVGVREGSERPVVLIPIWVALCIVELIIVTRPTIPARWRIGSSLVFLVLTTAMAGLFRHWLPYADSDVVRGFSVVTTILIVFAVVVPVRPMAMAAAASLAALTDPLTLWATLWLGNPMPPWNVWLWLCLPSLFGAGLAILTSRMLFLVEQRVAAAREVGAYQLKKRLGAGGMGEVWLAEHRSLTRPVAIKLVKAQSLGQQQDAIRETLQRFEREAQATAALTSVHTIEVYDFGVANDGTFFYVMEYLEGCDLETLMASDELVPLGRALHLLIQACHSLADAHEHGVVHRDIKPANIFVCRRRGDEFDFVKVLDFGLVKQETSGDETLTQKGDILGSPGFIAPEVLEARSATAAADVYAIGCVLFELLTNQRVFERGSAMAVMVAHARETPPRCRDLVPAVPRELDELVDRCLAKKPSARPTVQEIIGELERQLADRPWSREDAAGWWASHRSQTAAHVHSDDALAPTEEVVDLGPTVKLA